MKMKLNLLIPYLYFTFLYLIINFSNRLSIIAVPGMLALVTSVIWMIVSIVLYFIYIRKNKGAVTIVLYSLINSIVGGIAISAFYSMKNVTPYSTIILISVFTGLMVINFCFINLINRKLIFTRINMVLSIILIIFSFYLWTKSSVSLGSSLVFLSIIYLCFGIALHLVVKKSYDWSGIIPIASLIMFAGILLVVILAITEGDGLEIFDIDFSFSNNKKKKI